MSKITVRKKRNQIVYSYDRFRYTSLLGIFASSLFIGGVILDRIDFDFSEQSVFTFFILTIPGFILYSSIHNSFNSTNVSIDAWHVTVYPSPIPTRWKKTIRKKDIKTVYTNSKVDSSSEYSVEYHSVSCILYNGKEITIIDKITDRVDAKRIERAIGDSLNTPSDARQIGIKL
ncbi:hypothetical protein [Leptospira borgpetersenii]|uniref:Uncharacterized protein n=2 Tax=Leptospira borgpetersenii serovar Hardjo-bovis TaxID=338217 RepID=Q04QF3_LEPBJ|nr:hypothetical protein [Leptospira borgpetersenii]ABJ76867.1 Hypothetical protein LBJ_2407 [Leptospira borgpetersenii serovar Hardjo-bovis str. JB197]ABJ78266.1 Hypothetical protein LBL_0701 [Leptospira borgpetersenii serovar Hardjo-bovis str. L550]AMX57487.1 hypothetical protein LBK6_03615 [Leptospira borgpetersenii serovar Hardjo]AMX60718.1 hypothetical protein LBK9_03560 [Leptospira borgpetersenii serovar Hardjo]AMX63963.1 hypothetical protein LBK30_03600 [Leptospira borgpetersenii serovar